MDTVHAPQGDVTVVIPARNRAHVLLRALASVKAQAAPPKEVIVVDDASSDGTAEVAEAFGARVLKHPTSLGAGQARNSGIVAAETTWVAFLDSDDEWLPDHLQTVLAALDGHVFGTSVM